MAAFFLVQPIRPTWGVCSVGERQALPGAGRRPALPEARGKHGKGKGSGKGSGSGSGNGNGSRAWLGSTLRVRYRETVQA